MTAISFNTADARTDAVTTATPGPLEGEQRKLKLSDAKTLSLSALGGTLEYYDFVIYIFFAKVIGTLFFPPHMSEWLRELQTFGIFAAGYLARPLGGLVFGHFADRLGRKRMFTLSVLLMALPTLLIGCLPTYPALGYAAPLLLLVMRVLQGLAVGGELTGAWVFVGEHVPQRHYGFGLGVLMGGLTGGILVGSLVAGFIDSHYTQAQVHSFAWRLPFVLGGIFGLVAVYLRRLLDETPVFKEMQAQRRIAAEVPLRTVLRDYRGTLAYIALLTWALAAAVGVLLLLAPTYLQTLHHVPAAEALHANSVATAVVIIGNVLAGWLCDRVGAPLVMLVGWAGLLVTSYMFFASPGTGSTLLIHYALAGLFVSTMTVVPIVGVRAFPPAIRATGISFGYNVFYAVFGGGTPLFVTYLFRLDPMAPAHYVAALCVVGMAVAFLPLSRRGWQPARGARPRAGVLEAQSS